MPLELWGITYKEQSSRRLQPIIGAKGAHDDEADEEEAFPSLTSGRCYLRRLGLCLFRSLKKFGGKEIIWESEFGASIGRYYLRL
jgi:hypothetical protein